MQQWSVGVFPLTKAGPKFFHHFITRLVHQSSLRAQLIQSHQNSRSMSPSKSQNKTSNEKSYRAGQLFAGPANGAKGSGEQKRK